MAFTSNFNNLVPNDTNGFVDVFVHDRQTGQTRRVSIASDGSQGTADSYLSAISADGTVIAFRSNASLTPEDTNAHPDAYVHNLKTGKTERVSLKSDGTQFLSDGFEVAEPTSISADGRFVGIVSTAPLVPEVTTPGVNQAYIYDRAPDKRRIQLLSVSNDGVPGNGSSASVALSADGRFSIFTSNATNLVPGTAGTLYTVRDRLLDATRQADVVLKQSKPVVVNPGSTKVAGTAKAAKRSRVTFNVRIRNKGPARARQLAITTITPPGCRLRKTTSTKPIKCSSGAVAICNVATLAANIGATISLTFQPEPGAECSLNATVNSPPFDPNLLNNSVRAVAMALSGQATGS